jgi:hypothetical protein
MVWWSSSLALSASAPLPKVTKPNPFDPRSLNMISTSNRVPYFYKEKKRKAISVSLEDLYMKLSKCSYSYVDTVAALLKFAIIYIESAACIHVIPA